MRLRVRGTDNQVRPHGRPRGRDREGWPGARAAAEGAAPGVTAPLAPERGGGRALCPPRLVGNER